MYEPHRQMKVPEGRGKHKIMVLAPTLDEILKDDFDYGKYADEVVADLIVYHYPKKGQKPKLQRHLAIAEGVDLSDLLTLDEQKVKPTEYGKLQGELSKYYEHAIFLLQHKYEYNLNKQNPNLDQVNELVTNAMKVIAIDYLSASDKIENIYDCHDSDKIRVDLDRYNAIYESSLKAVDENMYSDLSLFSKENINPKMFVPISEIVRDSQNDFYDCIQMHSRNR